MSWQIRIVPLALPHYRYSLVVLNDVLSTILKQNLVQKYYLSIIIHMYISANKIINLSR